MRFTHEQQFFTNPSPGVARRSWQSGGVACRGQPAVAQARQGAVGRGGRTPHFAPKLGRATSARAGPVAGRLGRRKGAFDMDVVQASRGRTTRGRGGGGAHRTQNCHRGPASRCQSFCHREENIFYQVRFRSLSSKSLVKSILETMFFIFGLGLLKTSSLWEQRTFTQDFVLEP